MAALRILRPSTLDAAVAARAEHPDALVVAGGTGVLPELNRGLEPAALLDLSRVAGLRDAEPDDGVLRLGAGVTYTQVIEQLGGPLPGLAAASGAVASRQVRNRGTLAGALVLADPSGDALAALGAAGAEIELAGPGGTRRVAAEAFITAPGACALAGDELVSALHVPVADGPVAYAKVGARNAMARAVCAVAVALHPARRAATVCVVGAAPTAIRPAAAEAFVGEAWDALHGALSSPEAPERSGEPDRVAPHRPSAPDPAALDRFGALVAEAVSPDADDRGSAAYRRHAAAVLARRGLARAWAAQ